MFMIDSVEANFLEVGLNLEILRLICRSFVLKIHMDYQYD